MPDIPSTETGVTVGRLPLAGTFNVRDVGGLPVAGGGRLRHGRLLRGDALGTLDEAGGALLADVGLRTIIDLREGHESARRPNGLGALGVHEVAIPLYGGADEDPLRRGQVAPLLGGRITFGELYLKLVEWRGAEIAAAVGALARADGLPGFVHCTGGKDRTGIVIALTLSVVGVADVDVVADYARSGPLLAAIPAADIAARLRAAGPVGDRLVDPATAIRVEPAWMHAALAWVREHHGDAAAYLVAHGLTIPELDQLRAALVEPAAS